MEDHETTTQIALTVPNQPRSLPTLHFDIMSFIAAYFISDPSNLLNYQLTCKEWYIASRPLTYRTISLRKIEDFVALFHLIDTEPMVEHWIHELKISSFQYHTSIPHWEDPEGNLLFVEKVASYLSSHENDFYLPALRTLHLSGFYLPPPRTSQPQGVETSKAVVSFLDVLRTRFSTISKLKLTSCSFTVDDINILVFDLPRFRHLELCEIYNSCLRKDIIPTHGPPNLMSISCTESGDVCSNLMWWIPKTPSTSTLQSIRFDLLSLPALEILDEFLHEMGPNLKFLDVYVDVISIERGRELDLKIDLSWNRSLEIITFRYAYYLGFIKHTLLSLDCPSLRCVVLELPAESNFDFPKHFSKPFFRTYYRTLIYAKKFKLIVRFIGDAFNITLMRDIQEKLKLLHFHGALEFQLSGR